MTDTAPLSCAWGLILAPSAAPSYIGLMSAEGIAHIVGDDPSPDLCERLLVGAGVALRMGVRDLCRARAEGADETKATTYYDNALAASVMCWRWAAAAGMDPAEHFMWQPTAARMFADDVSKGDLSQASAVLGLGMFSDALAALHLGVSPAELRAGQARGLSPVLPPVGAVLN